MDGAKGVASTTDAGWGGGEVKDSFQALVLEIDASDAPEGGIWFQVKLKGTMEMRRRGGNEGCRDDGRREGHQQIG